MCASTPTNLLKYFPFEQYFCLLLLLNYQFSTSVTSSEWIHSKAGKVISHKCTNSQALDKARTGSLDPLPTTDSSPCGLWHPGETHLPAFSLLPTPQHCQERYHGRQRSLRGSLQLWNPKETAMKMTAADSWRQPRFPNGNGSAEPTARPTVWTQPLRRGSQGLYLQAGKSLFLFDQMGKD